MARAPIVFLPLASGYPDLSAHHRELIADRVRVRAFTRAIEGVVREGDRVADLGTGTGLLAMAAARAGARRVYAIELRAIIGVARANVRANGLDTKVELIPGDGRDVALPEPVEVIVSDAMGTMAVGSTMLSALGALRDRSLAPGGRVIPAALALRAAPVSSPAFDRFVAFWSRPRYGLDLSAADRLARHNLYNVDCPKAALLAPPETLATLDLAKDDLSAPASGAAAFTAARAATLHGWCGWFDADMGAGVRLSNAPGRPSTVWRQVFFPLARPLRVMKGDRLELALRTAPADRWPHVTDFDWTTRSPRDVLTQSTRDSFPA